MQFLVFKLPHRYRSHVIRQTSCRLVVLAVGLVGLLVVENRGWLVAIRVELLPESRRLDLVDRRQRPPLPLPVVVESLAWWLPG